MPIDPQVPDTMRAVQHERDLTWPTSVSIQLWWVVDGEMVSSSMGITADMFFGRGSHGAPLEGSAIVGMIENLRRAGPPAPELPLPPLKARLLPKPRKKNAQRKS